MTVFKSIEPNDIYVTPYEAHKEWNMSDADASSSYGVQTYLGEYVYYKNSLGDNTNTEVVSLPSYSGYYEYLVHDSMNHMFYDKFIDQPFSTLSKPYLLQDRMLHKKCSIINIPQNIYGEHIEKETVELRLKTGLGHELLLNSNFRNGISSWTYTSNPPLPALEMTESGNHYVVVPPKIITASLGPNAYQSCSIYQKLSVNVSASTYYLIESKIENYGYSGSANTEILYLDILNGVGVFVTSQSFEVSESNQVLSWLYYATSSFTPYVRLKTPVIVSSNANKVPYMYLSVDYISIKELGYEKELYDDAYGNLYDNDIKDYIENVYEDTQEELIGDWNFNECYMSSKDDRKQGIVHDYSIYKNHGYETNMNYDDGTYGTRAVFNQLEYLNGYIDKEPSYSLSGSAINKTDYITIMPSQSFLGSFDVAEFPLDIYTVQLSHSLAPGTNPLNFSVLMTSSITGMSTESIYEFSFYAKSCYATGSQKLGFALLDNNNDPNNYLFTESINVERFWNKYSIYLRPVTQYSLNYARIFAGHNENRITTVYDKLFFTKPRLYEIKQNNNIRIFNNEIFNLASNKEFSIESIITIPASQIDLGGTTNIIYTKNGRYKDIIQTTDRNAYITIHNNSTGSTDYLTADEMNVDYIGSYPYQLEVYNQTTAAAGKLKASRYDGTTLIAITSSNAYNDGLSHHVMFQKTGSTVQLFVDGILESTAVDFPSSTPTNCGDRLLRVGTKNPSDLFIGCQGNDKYNFHGAVDEFKMYGDPFSAATIFTMSQAQLSESFYYNVGNVFYEHGFINITSPYIDYKYAFLYTGSLGYDLTFKNSVLFTEVEVHCSMEGSEFLYTLNPTVRTGADITNERIACFATHSCFSPYVTTIGLYNNNAELLAIGKVSHPIKRLPDVDTTFIIRFDMT